MVTRYDVISSRRPSHFWVKMHVVDEIMQSNYLCIVLHVKRKKFTILTVFTWFLILDKIQDGQHVWWRHRPPAAPPPIKYTSSWYEDQRLSTKGKIISKYYNISKPLTGASGYGLRKSVVTWFTLSYYLSLSLGTWGRRFCRAFSFF